MGPSKVRSTKPTKEDYSIQQDQRILRGALGPRLANWIGSHQLQEAIDINFDKGDDDEFMSPEGINQCEHVYKDLKLNESQQVFKEDWVETSRKRERNLTASMGEKINDWEDKHLAIFRAIHEELWIILNEEQINKLSLIETNETRVSQSFPDIQTEYKFYTTDIILNENQYDPFWYIENQEDKNVYFNWKQKS